MNTRSVVAAPFLGLFRGRGVEENGLHILGTQSFTACSVVAMLTMTVFEWPDKEGMEGE